MPATGTFRYTAERAAYIEFADAVTAEDFCWLREQGVRVTHHVAGSRSVNVTLPDDYAGDPRILNPRIVQFNVRMR